ncbi:MBOAT family O-acyltransferase [Luteolibacter sp. Y139]|uniref:MBOAT family O-acyltransferase n=1 Tax=Luteolibacter soli TaxID=3135280 RepID=A0ABU9ASY5_9BACT
MLFNSWEFLILLVATFALYYAPWSRGRNGKAWQVTLALVASVIFYGWEDPKLIGLLAISCVGNSLATGRIILHKVAGNEAKVRQWTQRAVVMNLSLLGIFKYLPFLAGLFPFLPPSWLAAAKAIPLPIGISFYTFHGISMIVDVARGEVTREGDALMSKGGRFAKGVRDIGFYLLFFPQLVAGPIVKAKEFWPQISGKRLEDIRWRQVVRALITGYFLKVFVADNLSEQTASLTLGPETLIASGPLNLIPLLYAYSLQIFADFAGYSLIAIGLAAMFGYRFPINFNFPYLSTSITEFWRRWHMSLSAWLRDYLYIPLGGNRNGPTRTYLNLFLVMFLGGLWHGAEWKFALWGSLHGLLLAMERLWGRNKATALPRNSFGFIRLTFGWLFAFHAVTLLWLTFLMPDMASIVAFFRGVFGGRTGFSGPPAFSLVFYGAAVVLYHAWGWLSEHREILAAKLARAPFEPLIQGVMLFLIFTNPGAPRGFIYFQF